MLYICLYQNLMNWCFTEETCIRGTVGRMSYVNFDGITARVSVIIDNWPLKKFCAPGDIGSRPELETLLTSWTDGATCFRSLTDVQRAAWKAMQASVDIPPHNDKSDSGIDGGGAGAGGAGGGNPDGNGNPSLARDESGGDTTQLPVRTAVPCVPSQVEDTVLVSPETPDPAAMSGATSAINTPSASTRPSATVNTSASDVAPAPRQRTRGEVSFVSINVVTGPDGRSIATAKRAHKPRQTKMTSNATPVPSAADTEPPQKKLKSKSKSKAKVKSAKSAKENTTTIVG